MPAHVYVHIAQKYEGLWFQLTMSPAGTRSSNVAYSLVKPRTMQQVGGLPQTGLTLYSSINNMYKLHTNERGMIYLNYLP
jgi:hypothetical protein